MIGKGVWSEGDSVDGDRKCYVLYIGCAVLIGCVALCYIPWDFSWQGVTRC